MYDHVTLRIPDLVAGTALFVTVLDQLEIEQTARTPSFAVWGNFALTETDEDHPIARRVHVAFIAPSPSHVDRFWQGGVDAGFADDGAAVPRRVYADDYCATFLKDAAGNSFEAVYRDSERPRGNIDHVAIRVADVEASRRRGVEASTAFYSTIRDAAGLTLRRQSPDSAAFAVGASDGSLLIFAGRTTESVHIAFSGADDDMRRFHANATAPGYRSNGEPGEPPAITPATTPPMCSTPTATTSKSSTTTASGSRGARNHASPTEGSAPHGRGGCRGRSQRSWPNDYPATRHGVGRRTQYESEASMPMIDVYAIEGTFGDKHTLAQDLAKAVMRWEQVPEISLFTDNTAAFIHDLPADAISNAAGDSNYVRVQVLTPINVLDRGKHLGVVKELTEIVVASAGDPTLADRTWVMITESPEGGWGIDGHANTGADIVAAARAALEA